MNYFKWNWNKSVKDVIKFAIYLIVFNLLFFGMNDINEMFSPSIPVGYILIIITGYIILNHLHRLYKFDKRWINRTEKSSKIFVQICMYLIVGFAILSINTQTVISGINDHNLINIEYQSCNITIYSECSDIEHQSDVIKYNVMVTNNGNLEIDNMSILVSLEDKEETKYILDHLRINETKCVYNGYYSVSKEDIIGNGNGNYQIDILSKASKDHGKHGKLSIPLKYKFTSYNPGDSNYYIVGADNEKIILINNESAIDPTYNDLIRFIKTDTTSTNPYVPDVYTCGDFAEDVHNKAEMYGYRAGWVEVDFYDDPDGHALNVFNTPDKGIIYIDCVNGDTIINMEIGKDYKPIPIGSSAYRYSSLGKIKSFNTFW